MTPSIGLCRRCAYLPHGAAHLKHGGGEKYATLINEHDHLVTCNSSMDEDADAEDEDSTGAPNAASCTFHRLSDDHVLPEMVRAH